jgi:60 kDa SS-A/Ro ribonucleoprotein
MDKPVLQLAYLVTKYKNRNGWTHTDVLRLAHPCAKDSLHDFLFAYVVKGYQAFQEKLQGLEGSSDLIEYIDAVEALMASQSPEEAAALIERYNLAREHVPTTLLNEPEIWRALSKKMPMVALMRNLNKMTSVGVFSGYPDVKAHVIAQLTNEDAIKRSGVHPLQALIALNTYSKGKGEKGSLSWEPIACIESALEAAFKLAFNNVEPTHKRIMYALDVSGSMTHSSVCGIETMTASQVSVAMSMVLAAREPNHVVMGFADKFKDLGISPDYSLKDSIERVYMNTFGATDISLPFTWALETNRLFDVFVVFTDNETNCSKVRPADALRDYRKKTGINAKLVVVGLSANKITVADPNDPGMMDVAGFDPDVPSIIRDFSLS